MSTDPADGPSDRSESPVATEPLRRERAEPPSAVVVQDLGPALHDYGDAALALDALDLLIGDTSVVHLAGALGKPVWLLLSDVPDLDRGDCADGGSARPLGERQRPP